VRQRVDHKRSLLYLEQIILKNEAHLRFCFLSFDLSFVVLFLFWSYSHYKIIYFDAFFLFIVLYRCINIQSYQDGLDFFFEEKTHALKFLHFLGFLFWKYSRVYHDFHKSICILNKSILFWKIISLSFHHHLHTNSVLKN